ncbi:hypothetical protein BJ944DRAFT_260929 [Cunninghamella echinulata]|nr:hypothetical protein BJ944DRAFT_260929 [Cunninghamella echinulata]
MKFTVPSSGGSRASIESGRPSSRNNNQYNRSNAPPPPVTYTSSEYSYKEDPYSPKHYHSRPSTPSTTSQVKNHHNNKNHAISTQQPGYYNDDDDGYQQNNSNSYLLHPQQHQQHQGRGSYDQYHSYSEQDDYIPPFAPHLPTTTNNNKIETSSFDIDSDSKKNKFQRFREKGCKMWVSIIFVFIIVVAIVWYFVWPRLFTLNFVSASLNTDTEYNWIMVNNNNTDSQQQQLPAGVTAQWNISLNTNNADNWVPTQVQDLYMEIINIGTGITFGKGHSGSLVLPAKSYQTIYFNVSIDYHPLKIDDTLRDLLNACYHNGSTSSNTPSQGLRVVLDITYYIRGIAWTSRAHNRISQLACPS